MDFYQEIPFLVECLAKGDLALLPTDTIWGIACDATNMEAVRKIDAVKQRKKGKNYVLLIDCYEHLQQYVSYIPIKARNLIEFHRRPLTIIYDQPQNLPQELLAEDGTVAIRVTKDSFCQELIATLGKPIVATSANISGEPFAVDYKDITKAVLNQIPIVAQYKRTAEMKSTPSTIVKVEDNKDLIFIRK